MDLKRCIFNIGALGIGGLIAQSVESYSLELTNPASLHCIKEGGMLKISQRGDGGQYGICIFEDNRQCEEWALFRGECPKKGRKITGYLTPEGIYCAIKGGAVLENETICQLPSGVRCTTDDLYKGRQIDKINN